MSAVQFAVTAIGEAGQNGLIATRIAQAGAKLVRDRVTTLRLLMAGSHAPAMLSRSARAIRSAVLEPEVAALASKSL